MSKMPLLDLFRQEYVKGKVVDKYKGENGNLGMIVEDEATKRRYHIEFRDNYRGPSFDNLYGLLNYPFARKTEPLDKLINKDDTIEITLSYNRGPFRQAYQVHSVYKAEEEKPAAYNSRGRLIDLPYRQRNAYQY